MAAAHHAAQRPAYSLPTHPSSNSFPPDDLRLPSIKDLQFHYQPRRQDHSQPPEPTPGYEHNHSQPQDRVVRHPPHWARPPPPPHSISQNSQGPPPPPPSNPIHQLHSQQHSSQPPPQVHETSSKPPDYHHRHENNGYATPGLPLSAQTAPVPGSVNSGPAVRSEDYHPHGSHKRARTGDRAPVASLRDTRPPSAPYHYPPSYPATGMPPPSPYHQNGPSSGGVPPSPVHPTHSSPQVQHHHPLPPPQSYGNYHPSQYSQPPPPRSTNAPHPIPVSAPPAPPAQTPTTPLPPPTPTSASAQPTQVLSYAQSAHSSVSQEWETPPQQPPQQHFQHYTLHATHPPPPPPPVSTPPAPSTPSAHHVQQLSHSHHHPPQPPPPVHSQPPPQTAHSMYQSQSQQVQTTPQVQAPAPAPTQPYAKTTSVNPTDFDTRGTYSTHNTAPSSGSSPDSAMSELVNLCSLLYDFASRYAQLNGGVPGPTPHEIAEMASRANEVVRLLEELRRAPDGQRIAKNDTTSAEDHRPPKRPWEDMAEEGQISPDDDYQQQEEAYETTTVEPVQSTAELDMELIRTKRATTTAGAAANTGQPKSKYRKRSASLLLSYGRKYGADPTTLSKQRATPPGKCHSCNIRETPEWRRGPDGARTLCNACGLHYAKLMRKQNKMNPGPNGEPPPPIDMDMLRASTRAAEAERHGPQSQDGSPTGAPTHHQGSFQVITIPPPVHSEPPSAISPTTSEHPQTVNTSTSTTSVLHIPPPPWSTSPPVGGRGYQPSEQQSFIRSSIPTNSPR